MNLIAIVAMTFSFTLSPVLFGKPLEIGVSSLHAGIEKITPEPVTSSESEPSLAFVGEGYAAHYNYNTMDKVATNRGLPIQECMISYTEAYSGDLGDWLYIESQLQFSDGVHGMWCQITDMPQEIHRGNIRSRGIIVELRFEVATPYLCGLSYPLQEPPRACPVFVYR